MISSTLERVYTKYSITDFDTIKAQMLSWVSRFNICCFLDNHAYDLPYHAAECLCGAGAVEFLSATAGQDALGRLGAFCDRHRDWLFGHLGYELTEETEPLSGEGSRAAAGSRDVSDLKDVSDLRNADDSRSASDLANVADLASVADSRSVADSKDAADSSSAGDSRSAADSKVAGLPDPIGFPDVFFFVPVVMIRLDRESIEIGAIGREPADILQDILAEADGGLQTDDQPVPGSRLHRDAVEQAISPFRARFSREEYLDTVEALRRHILRGDCYEINFCQEFYSSPAIIEPLAVWRALSRVSPSPFGAFYRLGDRYLLCASPERFIQKKGNRLLSQPIKGTSPRYPLDPVADAGSREALFRSAKDRSENVMVVDLVRNDLSRICVPGSVRVDELYGIYAFPQVFQMISTISGELPAGMGLGEVLSAAFPMGSMTGAPKRSVVGLIREYERTRRGIFSGAVGYIQPDGDLDLNVVIRSLLYNEQEQYLSYLVGSGITFYSDPAMEYEECMMKAAGMKRALEEV